MQRRKFLKNTSAAGLSSILIAGNTVLAQTETEKKNIPTDEFELSEATIDMLQH